MQMWGNIAQRKNRFGRQNLGDLADHLSPESTLREEAEGALSRGQLESNGTNSSSAGLLLLDASYRLLYANQEAHTALTYPGNPGKNSSFDAFLEGRVQSLFTGSNGSRQLKYPGSFPSGRRRYKISSYATGGGNGRSLGSRVQHETDCRSYGYKSKHRQSLLAVDHDEDGGGYQGRNHCKNSAGLEFYCQGNLFLAAFPLPFPFYVLYRHGRTGRRDARANAEQEKACALLCKRQLSG